MQDCLLIKIKIKRWTLFKDVTALFKVGFIQISYLSNKLNTIIIQNEEKIMTSNQIL